MDNAESKTSCQIERIGEVIEVQASFTLILINGKSIEVPKNKVAEGIALGDLVVWTGNFWSKKIDTKG
ncbi:hypothetical protein [Paenibacillus sp. LHD-38]|uniref:hypothetical protein n=1 Tax=Paenibacillus sp. LHD-38 TaxID=3072143 RepID=UPI00280F5689|nr:hypothetical protein [Paenibacillus sp. LHD-38]MDQ8733691.1 hypothetical protein [Paenibacillus sp. LHD-38]